MAKKKVSKSKKMDVKVGLIRGNSVSKSTEPDVNLYNERVRRGNIAEKSVKPAIIISRLDHPIPVEYDGQKILISPRQSVKVGDRSKLQEKLPKGLYLKHVK